MTSERDSRSIDFSNAAKMTKYNLVMTPTPRRVAGCISIRRIQAYVFMRPCTYLVTYLLTYLHRITSVLGDSPVI